MITIIRLYNHRFNSNCNHQLLFTKIPYNHQLNQHQHCPRKSNWSLLLVGSKLLTCKVVTNRGLVWQTTSRSSTKEYPTWGYSINWRTICHSPWSPQVPRRICSLQLPNKPWPASTPRSPTTSLRRISWSPYLSKRGLSWRRSWFIRRQTNLSIWLMTFTRRRRSTWSNTWEKTTSKTTAWCSIYPRATPWIPPRSYTTTILLCRASRTKDSFQAAFTV